MSARDLIGQVDRLEAALDAREPDMSKAMSYYEGKSALPFLTKAHTPKLANEFRELLEASRTNFMRLVVDTVEERLAVEGIRLSASASAQADEETWRLWQENGMDAESSTAFLEALIKGVSYLSVWPAEEEGSASIAVEDACQTIVGYAPGTNYRVRAAALKRWDDGDGRRANLYLPEGIYKFHAPERQDRGVGAVVQRAADAWNGSQWRPLDGDEFFVPSDLGVVPIVPLRNRPRLMLEGESELADVMHVQDQINAVVFLAALAGYFGAHRQRWAVGLKIHEDANGKPVEPFDAAIDRLWQAEDGNVKFGEFSQTDLSGYIKLIEQKVLHIAVTTRTPRHYLIQEGQSPSGDAIKSAESGLVKKARRKHRWFGEGVEEALRIARRAAGMAETPADAETVWSDPEQRSEGEITDAVIKQHAAGLIPWEGALEKLGYTQTQIARFAAQRSREQLRNAALGLPAPNPLEGEA